MKFSSAKFPLGLHCIKIPPRDAFIDITKYGTVLQSFLSAVSEKYKYDLDQKKTWH
jgi:hypothetical protein